MSPDRSPSSDLSPRVVEASDVGTWHFDDDAVVFAIQLSERMGVLPKLLDWRIAERQRLGRHPGGAPERFPAEAVWVAMILAALHNKAMLATTFRDILFKHINATMRARLGVPEPPDSDDRRGWDALYRDVRTRFHSLVEAIDPSPWPKNLRLDGEAFNAIAAHNRNEKQLSDEVLATRAVRLTWVANAIIEASVRLLPRRIRRHWKGSVGVDATPVPAFAQADQRERGRGRRAERRLSRSSADPDAGWYQRSANGDAAAEIETDGGKRFKRGKGFWSYEATFVIAGNDDPNSDPSVPPVIVGMAVLHRPGVDPGPNAISALQGVVDRGHPAAWLAADRAYSNTRPEDFQLPARALGYDLVLDYRVDQLGVQDSFGGALFIEGWWYSPSIPESLINATRNFRAATINEATYQTLIEARRDYRLRLKEKPDREGHMRLMCAAAGAAPTVGCANKPPSIELTTSARPRISLTPELRDNPARICVQDSVTFPPEAGAKLLQLLHYGSPEWAATYHTLRNTIEGFNGIAKDGAYAALGDATRRRIRGVAAQTVFVALLAFAANVNTIMSFLQHAVTDAAGVARRPRKRRRTSRPISDWTPPVLARSGAPPP
jgi:hypothetical protein